MKKSSLMFKLMECDWRNNYHTFTLANNLSYGSEWPAVWTFHFAPVCLFGFLTSSSATMLSHGRALRLVSDNFSLLPHRDRAGRPWLLSQPAGHIILTLYSRSVRAYVDFVFLPLSEEPLADIEGHAPYRVSRLKYHPSGRFLATCW